MSCLSRVDAGSPAPAVGGRAVTVARVNATLTFPSRIILVVAMNLSVRLFGDKGEELRLHAE